MTKTPRKVSQRSTRSSALPKKRSRTADTSTVSIRMSQKERELLSAAADLQDLSPAQFLKQAVVSRAAHVINTRTDTTFDFEGTAKKVATLLFTEIFETQFRQALYSFAAQADEGFEPATVFSGGRALCHQDCDHEQDGWFRDKEHSPEVSMPEKWSDSVDDDGNPLPGAPITRNTRNAMTSNDFTQLRRAIRLGGVDFLGLVLSFGEKYFPCPPLDEPIDPQAID